MVKIRDMFHKIGNLHNKISVAAGISKAELKNKFKESPAAQEIEKVVMRLSEVEQVAVQASKDLRQLKDMIYSIVDPDTGKPK